MHPRSIGKRITISHKFWRILMRGHVPLLRVVGLLLRRLAVLCLLADVGSMAAGVCERRSHDTPSESSCEARRWSMFS